MNHGNHVVFRAIPLAMAVFCFAYGAYIYAAGDDPARLTAGGVVFFLGPICTALYCMAAAVVRQSVGTHTETAKYLFPAIGYAFALATLICGVFILASQTIGSLVTGRLVCGSGLVAVCVSTVAAAASRFSLIARNTADASFSINPQGFTIGQSATLIGIVIVAALAAWVWSILLFARGTLPAHFAAGSCLLGIACICTSFVALVVGIVRQTRGSYTMREKSRWTGWSVAMGAATFILGIVLLIVLRGQTANFVGFVTLGLAMICWSVSSQTIMLAKVWHDGNSSARNIAIVPILMAYACFLLAAFLFEAADEAHKYFVPARILAGFGAVCAALYAAVSIFGSCAAQKNL